MQNKNNHSICGDANVSLLNVYNINNFDMFMANGFIPTITEPTRVTMNSASLIDLQTTHIAIIITTNISDNYPNFIFIDENADEERYTPNIITGRNFNKSIYWQL